MMIRVNVFIQSLKEENNKPLKEKMEELMELSLKDKGCISYDAFASIPFDDRYFINETWESAEDLKVHEQSEHFKRLVPELQKLGTLTLEKFEF